MSLHIGATPGQIADTVLLPGDPLRARHIAETFLTDTVLYNEVRGMYGYTGTYRGRKVSVQGTGMGVPSISIYAHELLKDYKVRTLIRVGTCGGMSSDVHVRDVILAMSAATDSSVNGRVFGHVQFAPTADWNLLNAAFQAAAQKNTSVKVGPVFTTDSFYGDETDTVTQLAGHGVLAVEMETAALYTMAAKFQAHALAILTVSDHLLTGEQTTATERQNTFNAMIELALETALSESRQTPE